MEGRRGEERRRGLRVVCGAGEQSLVVVAL